MQRAATGDVYRLTFRTSIGGPCMRCLTPASVTLDVDAREYHASDTNADDELRSEYVVEGELDFTIGNETRRLKSGDSYIIPGNVPHGCAACAGHALVLDIFSPVREEYKT